MRFLILIVAINLLSGVEELVGEEKNPAETKAGAEGFEWSYLPELPPASGEAMQAGLAGRKLCFRDVFMMRVFFLLCVWWVLLGWIRDFILRGVDLGSNRPLVFRPNNT